MAIIHIVLFEWKASTSHAQVEEVSIRVQHLFTTDRTPKQRSNGKDSIRQKENQNASNRQCSHLKDSCSCVLLTNQT